MAQLRQPYLPLDWDSIEQSPDLERVEEMESASESFYVRLFYRPDQRSRFRSVAACERSEGSILLLASNPIQGVISGEFNCACRIHSDFRVAG